MLYVFSLYTKGDAKLTRLSANIISIKKCIHVSTMLAKAGLLDQCFPTWGCPKGCRDKSEGSLDDYRNFPLQKITFIIVTFVSFVLYTFTSLGF